MGLLRLLLAISVFFAHVAKPNWYTGLGGQLAVEAFFLISGFYMSSILRNRYLAKRKFYINRALRIFPIYYFILILSVLQTLIFSKLSIGTDFKFPISLNEFIAFLPNLVIFGSDWTQFLNIGIHGFSWIGMQGGIGSASTFLLIAPAWTLGLELSFYLIAPRIVQLSQWILVAAAVLLFAVRLVYWSLGFSVDPWSYRFFIFELPIFFLGVIVERVKNQNRCQIQISIKTQYFVVVTFYLIMGIVISKESIGYFWVLFPALAFVSLMLLGSTNQPFDKRIGELSYPLYLCHILAISSCAAVLEKLGFFGMNHSRGFFEVLALVLSILIAKVLLNVSSPVEKIRDKIRGS